MGITSVFKIKNYHAKPQSRKVNQDKKPDDFGVKPYIFSFDFLCVFATLREML
jgi:hypothetical protein